MSMNILKFRITGDAPLLVHNGQGADPLSPISKAIKKISGKRNKTDADFEEMAHLEYLGSLYLHKGEPCIPGEIIEAAIHGRGGAARKVKMGKQAQAGLFSVGPFPLEYDGPRDPEELWEDERFRLVSRVRIGPSSVMRTRPMFPEWACPIEVTILPNLLNEEDVIRWMDVVGSEIGIGDWRPKFGRFSVEFLNGK